MSNTIVVTAATGNIGSKLVKHLVARKLKVRAIARNKQKLELLAQAGAEISVVDVQSTDAVSNAFSGAKAVFTLVPPNITSPNVRAYYAQVTDVYLNALQKAGVKNVVNLSSVGAHLPDKTGPILGLRELEQRLDKLTNVNVLHLRPAYFMENLFLQLDLIKNMGITGSPLRADFETPMIATDDIATVAAERLEKLDFTGTKNTSELLGQRHLTMNEVTQVIGKAIGRSDLKYVQFPYEDAKKAMIGMGLSENFAAGLIEMNRSMNEGVLKGVEVRSSKNTTPTSIEQFVAKYFAPAFGGKKETASSH